MRKIPLLGLPLSLLLVAVLIVAALPAPVQGQQTVICIAHGDVTLNGVAAPMNTTVEVFIGSDAVPSGSCYVYTPGGYALPVASTSNRIGDDLTYKVNGIVANKFGPDPGVFGYAIQEVNLKAISDPSSTTLTFTGAGCFPKHLPDSYYGQVVLDSLLDVPAEVLGVFWFDDDDGMWKFWSPGISGCTLMTLGGGYIFDYVVAVNATCEWNIPLQ